jgi:hypothetical protein
MADLADRRLDALSMGGPAHTRVTLPTVRWVVMRIDFGQGDYIRRRT